MKALTCPAILTSASTRQDGSLGLRFATPELESAEKTAFFDLLNQNLTMLLQPAQEAPDGLAEIKAEFDRKSPSERLRGCLYVLWKWQHGRQETDMDFTAYYLDSMEHIIASVKSKLPEPQYPTP